MQVTDSVESRAAELLKLLQPHRQSPVMQRVNLYVVEKTGKKLPEFLNNGATAEFKTQVCDELIEIIKAGDWDKLPKVPSGQASPPPAASAAPTPAAIAPVAAKPPAAIPLVTPKPAPKPVEPSSEPTSFAARPAQPVATATPSAIDELAAVLAKFMPAPATAPRDELRQMVREEIADVLTKIAAALKK